MVALSVLHALTRPAAELVGRMVAWVRHDSFEDCNFWSFRTRCELSLSQFFRKCYSSGSTAPPNVGFGTARNRTTRYFFPPVLSGIHSHV